MRAEPYLPHTRPKRREEFVLDEDSLVSQGIHEGGFPRVRVPDNSDCFQVFALTCLAVFAAGSCVLFELLNYFEFVISEMALHDLGIGFSESAHGSGPSSALTRELHSHPENPRSHVADGGELDLELGFWGVGVLIEYLQYQVYPIPGLYFRFAFPEYLVYMVDLRGFQDIPDDDPLGPELFSGGDHLVELPGADIGVIVRSIPLLDALYHNGIAIGRHETLELRHT